MSIRKIEYRVSVNEISPASVQRAGLQGEHNATKLIFYISQEFAEALGAHGEKVVYRFEAHTGTGEKNSTVPAEIQISEGAVKDFAVKYNLENWLTRAGGNISVYLIFSILSADETLVDLYSYPARLRLEAVPDGKYTDGKNYESVAKLSVAAEDAAERAEAASDEAEVAAAAAEAAKEEAVAAEKALTSGAFIYINGDAENESEQTGAIFNDYKNNRAGLKGFNIQSAGVSQVDNEVTIPLDSVEGIEVGDVVSVQISNNYDYIGSVSAVDADAVTVTVTLLDPITLPTGKVGTIWLPYKPYLGTTVLGEYAFAANINTRASAKGASSFGEDNTAGGKRSFCAGGESNFVGYCGFVAGQKNKVRGVRGFATGFNNEVTTNAEYGVVFGTNNKVRSNGTYIEGSGNTDGYNQSMGSNHIEGSGNRISDGVWGHNHIEGTCNTVNGNAGTSHIEGANNTVAASNSHVQGQNNAVSGNNQDVGGNKNTVAGSSNAVRGRYCSILGSSITALGNNHSVEEGTSAVFVDGYHNTVHKGAIRVHTFGFENEVYGGSSGDYGINIVNGVRNILNSGYGSGNYVGGRFNKVSSEASAIVAMHIEGESNTVDGGNNSIISGKSNTVAKTSNAVITGQSNVVTDGSNSVVLGSSNKVTGGLSFVIAENSTVIGKNNFATANDIRIHGDRNRVFSGNTVVGVLPTVDEDGNTTNEGTKVGHTFAAGYGHKLTKDYQTFVGNCSAQDDEALFAVGNGTSTAASKRSNAFVVKSDGSARIKAESTEEDAVVRYSQLMNLIGVGSAEDMAASNALFFVVVD